MKPIVKISKLKINKTQIVAPKGNNPLVQLIAEYDEKMWGSSHPSEDKTIFKQFKKTLFKEMGVDRLLENAFVLSKKQKSGTICFESKYSKAIQWAINKNK
jgi:hypothetical protein